ncbi:MAG: hypothetical protein ABJE47_18515 [bacterium]
MEYYGDVANARGDTVRWKARLDSAGQLLWPHLVDPRRPSPFTLDSLLAVLDRRFGLSTNVGTTAGTLDLHAGHAISNERRTVRQYGHSAAVRFTVLDGMVSDGYQSWAWGGHPAHGGWATESEIIR